MTKEPFQTATSAEARSLLNKADIVQLNARFSAQQKVMETFIRQTKKKIESIQETCDHFAKLFTQSGGK